MIAYRRLLKELWALLTPSQKNKGGGAVQVGQLIGNATAAQREVLDLITRVPDRISVLKFMEREFGTGMVIELQPAQLYRLRRYLEVVIAKTGAAPQSHKPTGITNE